MMTNSKISKYVKNPVEIEAIQFTGGAGNAGSIINWILTEGNFAASWNEAYPAWESEDGTMGHAAAPEQIKIGTLEGTMCASVGDWVIKGTKGEFYPCKPDIFEKTYTYLGPLEGR